MSINRVMGIDVIIDISIVFNIFITVISINIGNILVKWLFVILILIATVSELVSFVLS